MHIQKSKLHNKQAQQPVHRQKFNKISNCMAIELSDSTQMCSKDNMRERDRENTTIGLSVTACTTSSILMVVAVVLVPAMELKLAECTKLVRVLGLVGIKSLDSICYVCELSTSQQNCV